MANKTIKPGQILWLVRVGNNARRGSVEPEAVFVESVGKKFITIVDLPRVKFYKTSLIEKSEFTPGYKLYLFKEVYLEELEVKSVYSNLQSNYFCSYGTSLSLDQLRRIKAIVSETERATA